MLKHRRSRKVRDRTKEYFPRQQTLENVNYSYKQTPTIFGSLSTGAEFGQFMADSKYYKTTENGFSTFYVRNYVNSETRTKDTGSKHSNGEISQKWGGTKGIKKRKPLHLWTVDEVYNWLQYLALNITEDYESHIRRHAITGRVLERLNDGSLILIGIKHVSDREKILQNILLLKMRQDLLEMKRNSSDFVGC